MQPPPVSLASTYAPPTSSLPYRPSITCPDVPSRIELLIRQTIRMWCVGERGIYSTASVFQHFCLHVDRQRTAVAIGRTLIHAFASRAVSSPDVRPGPYTGADSTRESRIYFYSLQARADFFCDGRCSVVRCAARRQNVLGFCCAIWRQF